MGYWHFPNKNNPPKVEPLSVLIFVNLSPVLEIFTLSVPPPVPDLFKLPSIPPVLDLFKLPSIGSKKHENTNPLQKLITQHNYQQTQKTKEIKIK